MLFGPGGVYQLVEALHHVAKGCRFDFRLGHIPRLQVQFLIEANNWLMFLSYWGLSVYLSLSLLFSPSLSEINKHILRWRLKDLKNNLKMLLG